MIALVRDVSPTINACQLTHLPRVPIDVERAAEQHRRYEELLGELGCEVRKISAAPELPDAVFVEDTAIVLDGVDSHAFSGLALLEVAPSEPFAGAERHSRTTAPAGPPPRATGTLPRPRRAVP